MGLPFGIFGLMYFPNVPESTNAPYLSKEEIQLALDRLPPKKDWGHDISIKSLIKRLFTSPDVYILTAYSAIGCALEAIVLQGLFLLWMKANNERFPNHATTTYPLGIQAVSIVSNIGAGYVIDLTNRRIPMVILAGVLQLVVAILLLIPALPTAGVFFAFYLAGTSYIVNPIIYGWASVICQRGGDDALRSVILYIMSMVQSVLYTFWGITLYPATDAPYWKKGYITMIVVVFAFFGATVAVDWVSLFITLDGGRRDVADYLIARSKVPTDRSWERRAYTKGSDGCDHCTEERLICTTVALQLSDTTETDPLLVVRYHVFALMAPLQ
jgi:ACS family pantothenate transporter-like MFS transporter